MRILMVGALSMQYVRDNWVRPLQKMKQYDSDFVDVSPLLSAYSMAWVEQYLYALIRKSAYDALFFYTDSINQEFRDAFFATVRQAGIQIVTFYADDEPEIWFQQNLPYDQRFDRIGTHSFRGLQRRQGLPVFERFTYLPWGYNEEIFYPLPEEKIYDVVYFGLNSAHPENPDSYLRDGFLRQKLLVQLYEWCKQNGYRFRVFGGGWNRHPILRDCAGGVVSNEEMVRIYSQTRIVFNPGFSADNQIEGYQTKLRHFEVPGCKSCQITNYNPELAELYEENESILFFRTEADLIKKVADYLENPSKCEQIAQKAYEVSKQKHTMRQRIETLLSQVQPVAKNSSANYIKPLVKTLRYISKEEACVALADFAEGKIPAGEYDYLQILAGPVKVEAVNQDLLRLTQEEIKEEALLLVSSYIQLAALWGEKIQRRRHYMRGLVVSGDSLPFEFPTYLRNFFEEECGVISGDNTFCPWFNLLLPKRKVPELAQALLENSVALLKQFKAETIPLVFNDLRVDHLPWTESFAKPIYIEKMEQLLRKRSSHKERIFLYGIKGNMAEQVMTTLKENKQLICGVLDRSLNQKMYRHMPVYSSLEELKDQGRALVLITAEHSGPKIYEDIQSYEGLFCIVPLYDLKHAFWEFAL